MHRLSPEFSSCYDGLEKLLELVAFDRNLLSTLCDFIDGVPSVSLRAFRAPVSSHRRLHNMDVVNIQITNWDPNKIEVMCV